MSTETREAKKALRKDIKQRLSALSEADILKQSHIAQKTVLSLPQYQDASRLSIYLAMPASEALTDAIVRHALANDKTVFVPHVHSVPASKDADLTTGRVKVMDMLHLRSLEEYSGLERDAWGIPHLRTDAILERANAMGGSGPAMEADLGEAAEDDGDVGGLDLVVVPGVAFDEGMGRLGHGAGFYDSYLTRYCKQGKRRRPFLVGLCLAEQVLPEGQIEMQEHDWRVDAVAVGDGRLLTSKEKQ